MVQRVFFSLRRWLVLPFATLLSFSFSAHAQNTFFYGAAVRTIANGADEGTYVIGMSKVSLSDAKRIACGHFDPKIGNATTSSPQHHPSCLSGQASADWVNPYDGTTWHISFAPLECKNTRYFAVALGFNDAGYNKTFLTCGKSSRQSAKDSVLSLCSQTMPKCTIVVAALGDGSFGGLQGVGMHNSAICWGRDAEFGFAPSAEQHAKVLSDCNGLAKELQAAQSAKR